MIRFILFLLFIYVMVSFLVKDENKKEKEYKDDVNVKM